MSTSLFPANGKTKTLTIGAMLIAMMGYLAELRIEVAVISSQVDRIERIIDAHDRAPLAKAGN